MRPRAKIRLPAAALLLFAGVLILSGCPYYRPDEVEPLEVVRAANGLLSSSPEFTRTFMPHPEFAYPKAELITRGMSPEEVESLFGRPDRALYKVMELDTPEPWPALVFEYDMGSHPDGRYITNTNTFVFSRRFEPPRLSYWDLQMLYQESAPEKGARRAGSFGP